MAQHNELGRRGEDYATAFLLSKGYSILERNWRSGHKEVDIIAIDGSDIVFVEVKTRTSEDLVLATDAVDDRKRHNLVLAADAYIRMCRLNYSPRFDIITVVGQSSDPDAPLTVEHIVDAYRAPLTRARKYRSLR